MFAQRLLLGLSLWVLASCRLLASVPDVTTQPQSRTVIEGTNHTFAVTASGTAPLSYQWRKDGGNLSNQTNSSLVLTAIQTNDAGFYSVVVTNAEGSVTSALARLTVRLTNDPVYPIPQGGWNYLYTGDGVNGDPLTALDGTWNHQNDQWSGDGRGIDGTPGGVSTTNGLMTLEDAVALTSGTFNNRRIYLTRDLAQDTAVTNAATLLNDGVTLTFRARLTPTNDPLLEITNAPNGHVNNTDGKGMFGLRQSGSSGMIISFSLGQAIEDTNATGNFTFAGAGLHMNNLNGNARNANVDPGEGGTTNLLVVDPTVFHEFWITIQDNGSDPGTHRVSIYRDGGETPVVFNVTAGSGNDIPSANYLALGMGNSAQRGAMDVDFFGYKAGVAPPAAFNQPVGINLQPTNQFVSTGQVATFSVGVTGTPPYSIQWYRDGAAISGATNFLYATAPVGTNDEGAQFVVVVANDLNTVTSSPPALLHLLGAPVITAQPQSLTVTNGDAASFSVTAASGTSPTYQWRLNGSNLSNATNSTFVIASASSANVGGYDVIVANAGGSVTSTVASLTVVLFDFGDAPDPTYPTLKASDGARHIIVSGVRLGAANDAEVNGLPNAAATGDDLNGSDDEDGVNFLVPLRVGRTATAEVVASTNGVLNAWIDYDRNGSWTGAGEQVFTNTPLVIGTNTLQMAVPLAASLGSSYARFRFSTAGGLSFNGAAIDGEVEDYAVTIAPVADLTIALTDGPDPVAAGSNLTYSIVISNAGPSTAASVTVTDPLPAGFSFVSATPSQGSCGHNAGVVTCPVGALASGGSVAISLVAVPSLAVATTNTVTASAAEFDPNTSNNSASAATTVLNPPTISVQPQNRTVTNGANATFNVTAAGEPPLRYEWRFNGGAMAGQTNSSLTVSNAQVANAGSYTVRVTNQVGAIDSQAATLTVLVAPAITTEPQSRTNLAGGAAVFNVTATGTTPLSYQWRFDTTNLLAGETNASLILSPVQVSNAGPYQVVVSNAAGFATSVVATLTVIEMDFGDAPGYPTLLAANGARHRLVPGVRLGATIDFEPEAVTDALATGDDLAGSDDEDGVTFSGPLRAGQVIGVSVVAATNGQLNAWVDFNRDGSWAQAGEQIFTNRTLAIGTNNLAFVVPGGANPGISFVRFRFNTTGGLSFDGEAANGEVEDYQVTVEAVTDLSLKVDQYDFLPAGSEQVYSIVVSNAGPSAAASVTLTDTLPPEVVFIGASTTQGSCSQAAGIVTCPLDNLAVAGVATVSITVLAEMDGNITNAVAVGGGQTDLNATNNSAQLVARVMQVPEIISQPQSQTVTNGGTALFSVTANGTALRYQWRLEGVNLANATNASLTITNVQATNAGNYTVRVTNEVGAVISSPATLTVLGQVVITTQPQSQTVNAGATATLSVAATGTPPLSYQWEFAGSDLFGETGSSLALTNIQPSQAGNYRVRVSNPVNTATSVLATITVQQAPVFTTQPQTQTNVAGTVATLTAQANGTSPIRYQWYFQATNALASQTNTSLVLSNTQASQSGNYFVAATNVAGSATSAVAVLTVFEVDFGDAPESLGYPVTTIFNGARHRVLPGVHLGAAIDFETNGLPSLTATGDDLNGIDDEDGVSFPAPLLVGQTVPITVVASTNGFLDAWIDFAANGTWVEAGDQVLASYAVVAGTNSVPVPISAFAQVTNTFARFRFSTNGGLSYDGFAGSGEVEDYAVTIQPAVDVGLAIFDSPDPVFVQSNLTYTIVVTNRGPLTATGVFVTNDLPPSVTFLSAVSTQGTCSNAGGRVVCSVGALAVSGGARITVDVRPGSAGTIISRGSVVATQGEAAPGDNLATQSTVVMTVGANFTNSAAIPIADGTATGPGTGNPYPSTILVSGLTGVVAKVTVTLNNVSHSFSSDLDILLVGPGGQSVLLMSDAGGGFAMSGLTLTFDDYASLSLPSGGVISSTSYRPTSFEPGSDDFPPPAPAGPFGATLSVLNGGNPNGTWSLYVIDDFESDTGIISGGWRLQISTADAIADVAVSVADIPDPVAVNSNLVYSVTATNRGPAHASGVQLTNVLPAGVTFVSAVATQGSCTNQSGIVRCDVGNVLSGGTVVATITVTPTTLGLITNTVSAGAAQFDLVSSNNLVRAVTSVRQVTDLALTHAASTNTVVLGQDLTYSIAVSNRGPLSATSVRLTDTLPLNVDVVAVGSSQGACTNNAGTLICDLATIPSGSQVQMTVIVHPTATGNLTNAVSLAMDQIDSAGTNNASAVVTPVVVVADVAIAVSDSPDPVAVSNQVTYAVSVTNLGPSTASAVTVTNRLPANVSFVSATSGQGSCTNENGTVRCDLGNLVAGAEATLTIVLRPGAAGLLTNTVGVTASSLDSVSSNNLAGAVTSVEIPPFVVTEPQSQIVTNGASVSFVVSAGGTAPIRYQWQFNGGDLGGATNSALSLTNVQLAAAGSYRVRLTNTVGGTVSAAAVLTVRVPPTISDIADNQTDEDVITPFLAFTVGDADSSAAALELSVISSNTSLVPTNRITFGGSGGSRTLQILPATNQSGSATITLQVRDPDGLTATDSFVLTVRSVNDAPVFAGIGAQAVLEDAVLVVPISVADVETASSNLLVAVVSSDPALIAASNIVASVGGTNQTLTLHPTTNQNGTATISVSVTDTNGAAVTNSFLLTVAAVNDPPTLNALTNLVILEDAPLQTVPLTGISAGPSNELQILTFTASSGNSNVIENLSVAYTNSQATGFLTFVPAANATGTVTLTIRADDGGGSNNLVTRTFDVQIDPVNDAPTISVITNRTTLEDTALGPIPFTIGDVETAVSNLAVLVSSSNTNLLPQANISMSLVGSNGALTLQPATNASGLATVTLLVSDGTGGSSSNSFQLTVTPVNDAPSLADVSDQSTGEDVPVVVLVGVGDVETPAGNLELQVVSSNTNLVSLAGISLGGGGSNRVVTLTPATNQFGSATITLTLNDGTNTVTDTFVLSVAAQNDPPTLGAIDNLTVTEDSGPQFVSLGGISSGATNEAQTLTFTVVSSDPMIVPTPVVQYTNGLSTGVLVFSPALNATGSVSITVTVDDGGTTNRTASRNFSVLVTPVNDLPVISPINPQTTVEDVALTLNFTVADADSLLNNLGFTTSSDDTNLVQSTGMDITGAGTNRTLMVTPAPDQFGSTVITIRVSDGDGGTNVQSFPLTVVPVNDPPTLAPLTNLEFTVGISTQTVVLSNITSGAANELQTLAVTAISSNTSVIATATVDYTNGSTVGFLHLGPVPGIIGTSTIAVTVDDGAPSNHLVTQSFEVTISSFNERPTISDIGDQTLLEDSAADIAFSIGDAETALANLQLSIGSSNTNLLSSANVTFSGSGSARSLHLLPATNQAGTATITVMVRDERGAIGSDSFVLTVLPVDDPPAISALGPQSAMEDGAIGPIDLVISSLEFNPASLSLTGVASNTNLVRNSGFEFGGAGSNRTVRIRPATNQFGTSTVTISVSDPNGLTATTSFLLTIHPVNDAPTLDQPAAVILDEDAGPQTIVLTGIGSGASNEIEVISLSATSDNAALIPNPAITYLNPATSGTLSYTPLANANGAALITVTASDGKGSNNTVVRSFSITVNPVNDAPSISNIVNQSTEEDVQRVVTFSFADDTTPGDLVQLAVSSSNTNVVPNSGLSLSGAGTNRTLSILPATNSSGSATITILATDTNNAVGSRSFVLTVNPVNDAPFISDLANVTVAEDTNGVTLNFTVDDVETGAGALVLTANTSNPALVPAGGLIPGGSGTNRSLTVVPAADQSGAATITVTVRDEGGRSASDSFVLTVTAVNDPPTLSSLPDVTFEEDSTMTLAFAINDKDNPVGLLTVSGSSSDTNVIPNAGISIVGTNASRVVAITPAANVSGSARITLVVSDGSASATNSFQAVVTAVNDAPSISDLANQSTTIGVSNGPIAFVVGDAESDAGTLTLAGASSNPSLVLPGNITFGGSGSNRTVTVIPTAGRSGSALITVLVDDGAATNSDTFVLTVNNGSPGGVATFANSSNLIIVDGAAAAPYPSTINVSGVSGAITDISVTLSNLTHGFPDDIDLLLVGPGGQKVMLMSDAGGGIAVPNRTLIFSDSATATLPDAGPLVAGTFKPTDVTPGDAMPAPAPAGPYGTNLSVFTGLTANGTWSLYGVDDGGGDSGAISNGWSLRISTQSGGASSQPPAISDIPNQSTNEDAVVLIPFTVSDADTPAFQLSLTATSTNTALVANANIFFDGNTTSRLIRIVPSPDQSGTTLITVTVSDGTTNASDSFLLTIAAVNDPPTLNPLPFVALSGNNPPATTVPLSGITSGAGNENQTLTITTISSNPSIVPTPSVTYTSPNLTGSINFDPPSGATGTATVTVEVRDGGASNNLVSRTFLVSIRSTANSAPTISAIGNQTIPEDGATTALPFTVADAETAAGSLVVQATSSNTNLVPTNSIVFGGSGGNRTVTVTPSTNQSGTSTITIAVTDASFGLATNIFLVTVNPVNDLPVVSTIADQLVAENTSTAVIPFTISDVETPAAGLSVTGVSTNTALVPNANIVLGGSGTDRAVVVTPAPALTGTSLITLTIGDGTATTNRSFLLTVTGTNDPPVISTIGNQSINEDGTLGPLDFSIGDPETPAGSLGLTVGSSNPALIPVGNINLGGSVSNRTVALAPVANASGAAQITLTVSDGTNQASSTFTVTVHALNDAPTLNALGNLTLNQGAGEQTVVLSGISSGATNENQHLVVTAASSNPALIPSFFVDYTSASPTGTLRFTPAASVSGVAVVAVTVNDGQLQSNTISRSFTVTVKGAPSISDILDQAIDEDVATNAVSFTIADGETPAAGLALTVASSNTNLFAATNLVMLGNDTNRTLTLRPATNQSGSATITVTVTDGDGLSASDTFEVLVRSVNDAPTLNQMGDLLLSEDAGLQTVTLSGITSGATNELQDLEVTARSSDPSLVPNPVVSYSSPSAGGTLSFTPLANATGVARVDVIVADGQSVNGSVTQSFNVAIGASNNAPTLSFIADATTPEDTPIVIGFSVGDAETASGALSVQATSSNPTLVPDANLVAGGSDGNRALLITPLPNQFGTTTVTLTLSDGNGGSVAQGFTLTVSPVNDLPVFSEIPDQAVDQDASTLPIAFDVSDVETPSALLNLALVSSNPALVPTNGYSLTGTNASRSLVISPAAGQSGFALITITATDTNGGVGSRSFPLLVRRTSSPPNIVTPPQSRTVTNGATVVFSVTVGGSGPFSYQWRRNGVDLGGQTGATLTIAAVQAQDAGSYTVRVGNSAGAVTSVPAVLRVVAPPSILSVSRTGNAVDITFNSESGLGYAVEFTDSLNAPVWNALPAVTGTGSALTVSDVAPALTSRFYRLRVD